MSQSKFKMPSIIAGMNVLWSPGNGSDFVPAIVTKVGINAINVSVLRPGATSFVPKEAVRHRTDPGFRKLQDPSKTGCWEFTDQDALLAKLAVKVLGPAVAVELHPGLESLIAAYTPEAEEYTKEDRERDDPDYVGA